MDTSMISGLGCGKRWSRSPEVRQPGKAGRRLCYHSRRGVTMGGLGPTTFVERVAVAARETVYSAAIAWLLDHDSPLTLAQRLALVRALAGPGAGADLEGVQAVSAVTEWQDVDILIEVRRAGRRPLFVAVENKIKSTEGAGQLAAYDQRLSRLDGDVAKTFLTLTGEVPAGGAGWRPCSYADLLRPLRALGSPDPHVVELGTAIERLVTTATAAQTDQGLAAAAFEDVPFTNAAGLAQYVREMRLEKVVQRAWMASLVRLLPTAPPWAARLSETRGQAILDLEAELADRPGFRVGLQVQWRTVKIFGSPHPYPKVATPAEHEGVERILATIREQLKPKGKPTRPGKRGFRSFAFKVLPPGRDPATWAAALAPYVERLSHAFPAVQPLTPDAGPKEDEAEDE